MFDKRCRAGVEQGLRPVGDGLRRAGITADQLTVAGLVVSVASGVAIGSGRLGLGAFLLALSALPDVLDGAVAKASGTASPRGAFFDSVIDRISDGVVLGGFAWYLAGSGAGGGAARDALLPMAVLGVSGLVSYERARAESLGFSARGGLMERAERMIALGIALVFSSVMMPVLWIMLVLTTFTAAHRFVMVWRQAGAPPAPSTQPATSSNQAGPAAGRLRAWRPGAAFGPRNSGDGRWNWRAGWTARGSRTDPGESRRERPRRRDAFRP